MCVISNAEYFVLLIRVCRFIQVSLHLFQCALQVSVDHEWDALLSAVIVEAQSLVVLTEQPDCSHLFFHNPQCGLQLCVRFKIVHASEKIHKNYYYL